MFQAEQELRDIATQEVGEILKALNEALPNVQLQLSVAKQGNLSLEKWAKGRAWAALINQCEDLLAAHQNITDILEDKDDTSLD